MKSKLKAPRTQRLKQKYYNPHSSFGFKFNMRRYNLGCWEVGPHYPFDNGPNGINTLVVPPDTARHVIQCNLNPRHCSWKVAGLPDTARHVIQCNLNPRHMSWKVSYGVA